MRSPRWEYGSDFHWPRFAPVEQARPHPWDQHEGRYFGSGRDALRAIAIHGATRFGWKRLFFPDFFCPDVVESVAGLNIELQHYRDDPLTQPRWPSAIEPTDAFLVMNYYGLRETVDVEALGAAGAATIEDHSHDPWSDWAYASAADYCLLSLRKTLPVPEGGVLWSPKRREVPPSPTLTRERERAAASKRDGMLLKALYLEGHSIEKSVFRDLLVGGETNIAVGSISGMTSATRTLLDIFPIDKWRAQRGHNYGRLASLLPESSRFDVLEAATLNCIPFNLTVVAESRELRDRLRMNLIGNNIYPAVLWAVKPDLMPNVGNPSRTLADRVLSLPCDARYNEADLEQVATTITNFINDEP